jgi:capsular exopolysaccharide synthesis family protein
MAPPAASWWTRLHLSGLRRRWWLVVSLGVLVAALVFVRDLGKTKQYSATTTVLFGNSGSSASTLLNANASSGSSADGTNTLQATTVLLITSGAVTNMVKRQLHLSGNPATSVTASAQPDANLIDITAVNPHPALAAALANAYATQYQNFIRTVNVAGLKQAIAKLQVQFAATPRTQTVQRSAIESSIASLVQQEATTNGGVQTVDPATAPTSPSSPRPKRDAAIGLLLGLALGIGLVFVLDSLDRRLRETEALEKAYGQPSVVTIPQQRRADMVSEGRPGAELTMDVTVEPFRILRAGLRRVGSDVSRVILVTSATPGEGKSMTAVGLAKAWAITGRKVALIEADLRRPSFAGHFHIQDNAGGLANALRGRIPISKAAEHPISQLPLLSVFPSGGTPARSAELLSGEPMSLVLRSLAEKHDVVIIDAPPLLPVADTQALLDSDAIDGLVIVGRLNVVTRDQVTRVRQIIASRGWSEFSLVANGVPAREAIQTYGSGYGPPPGLGSESLAPPETIGEKRSPARAPAGERRS